MPSSIKDVAARAGVSIATVSHVVNGTRATRPHTRDRVLTAIAELGYSSNEAARNLARGRSSLLGLIISDIRNPFFPEVTSAFQDEAIARNMDALVLNTNYDAPRAHNSVRRLISLQVPGVAILTSQIDAAAADLLPAAGVPSVFLDLHRVGRNISNIAIDYDSGIAAALQHLAGLGHRSIAFIGGPASIPSAVQRKLAFLTNCEALGLTHTAVDAEFSVKAGYMASGPLLRGFQPTALLTGNDLIAIGVLHYASDHGLTVPDDLSLVGFDDIFFSEYTKPALTTVSVPRAEVGKTAFDALWTMMNNPENTGRSYSVIPKLVIRRSTAARTPA